MRMSADRIGIVGMPVTEVEGGTLVDYMTAGLLFQGEIEVGVQALELEGHI